MAKSEASRDVPLALECVGPAIHVPAGVALIPCAELGLRVDTAFLGVWSRHAGFRRERPVLVWKRAEAQEVSRPRISADRYRQTLG